MKKGLLIGGAIFLLLGAAGCAAGVAMIKGDFTTLDRHEYITNEYEFEDAITNLTIDESVTNLEIKPSENEKTKIVISELKDTPHTVTVNEGTLMVDDADWGSRWFDWIKNGPMLGELKTTIYLPVKSYDKVRIDIATGAVSIDGDYDFSSFTVKYSTGAVLLKGVHVENLEADGATGAMKIENGTFGNIDVDISTGGFLMENSNASRIKAKTSTGSIKLDKVVASSKIDLRSSTGSILMQESDAPEIALKSSTGSIRAETLTGKAYDCESDTGSVRKPADDASGGTLTAETSTGSIIITVKE